MLVTLLGHWPNAVTEGWGIVFLCEISCRKKIAYVLFFKLKELFDVSLSFEIVSEPITIICEFIMQLKSKHLIVSDNWDSY